MRKIVIILSIFAFFLNGCGIFKKNIKDSIDCNKTVVINGIKWATHNVDKPGRFTKKIEDHGMFYQWNRKKAWAANSKTKRWKKDIPIGITWKKTNDPCPVGWRIPTLDEIKTLLDKNKVNREWTIINGIGGCRFTDKTTGNSIFLPAAGHLYYKDGTHYNASIIGNYWSSMQDNVTFAGVLYCREKTAGSGWSYCDLRNGCNIRCVAK